MKRCITSLIAACTMALGLSASASASPVVKTTYGPIKGTVTPGVAEFLGIRYAAPPTGDLRWRPPQSPTRWVAPLDATQFGNVCPQFGLPDTIPSEEDCLFLNVYVPISNGTDFSGQDYPVMVWIHGGGLETGAGSFYDPTPLVKQGKVIVVTINYRLDALGFLAHPALGAGNYGLMDQQFAMSWVRQNIAAFGGNPHNVTIFGESAGGLSVLSNMASMTAAGLFNRAIAESGIYYGLLVFPSLTDSENSGEKFANDAGCGGLTASLTADCLRSLPPSTLLANEADIENGFGYLLPDIDGHVLTQSPDTAFETGQFNRVPVIDGTNHDEYRWFIVDLFDLSTGPITDTEYVDLVNLVFESSASAVLVEYPLANYPSPDLAYATLITDAAFSCSALHTDRALSQYVRTYVYEFADENAPPVFPTAFIPPFVVPQGSEHFSEIQYLFELPFYGEPTVPFTPGQQRLSKTMIRYWTNFATDGDPNSDDQVGPSWTRFSGPAAHEVIQSLVPPSPKSESESAFANDHNCTFWGVP
jgi:para-nitrobenzyl esterase